MNDNFKLYSKYYDLLYADKDYVAETNYIDHLIKAYRPKSKSILELGSGTGKHAFLLGDKGYEIIGLERSPDMVAIANKEKRANVSFKICDITNFNIHQYFDVATSLFHVISYLTDSKNILKCFKTVNHHLNSNGLFIFDVWHSPAVLHQLPEERTKKLQNKKIEVFRKASPIIYSENNIVEINYDIRITDLKDNSINKIIEKHPMRHFSRPEIEILALATGFEILHTEAFLSQEAASIDTWGVCYILKKVNNEFHTC